MPNNEGVLTKNLKVIILPIFERLKVQKCSCKTEFLAKGRAGGGILLELVLMVASSVVATDI